LERPRGELGQALRSLDCGAPEYMPQSLFLDIESIYNLGPQSNQALLRSGINDYVCVILWKTQITYSDGIDTEGSTSNLVGAENSSRIDAALHPDA